MKKTNFKELLKTIKGTLVSFLSIFVFVLLAVCLFLGLGWGSTSIEKTTANDFINTNYRDLEIQLKYSIDDLTELKKIDGFDAVEGYYKTYALFKHNDEIENAMMFSYTTEIDQLFDIDGSLPTEKNEILIEKRWGISHGFSIGDTIQFEKDDDGNAHFPSKLLLKDETEFNTPFVNEDGMQHLYENTFKVVGFCESPNYLSTSTTSYGTGTNNVPVNCLMFLNECAFDKESYYGYTGILVRNNTLRDHSFYSEDYEREVNEFYRVAARRILSIANNRYNQIIDAVNFYTSLDAADFPEALPTIMTALQSPAMMMINATTSASNNLRYGLSISLYVIAILICYSVVNRMVYEQSKQIGTKKALGFSANEITLSYLLYSAFASVFGAICGLVLARFLLEPIIVNEIRSVFVFGKAVYAFNWVEGLIISLASILFIIFVSVFSCRSNLKRSAISLLTGNDEKVVKNRKIEKTRFWSKLSLFTKTIFNNFANEKQRVIATIIGITGVATLMTCGLTFVFNASQSGETHYRDIQTFNQVVYFNEKEETASNNIKYVLEEEKLEYAEVYKTTTTIKARNTYYQVTLFVACDDNFDNLMSVIDQKGKTHSVSEGVWLSNSIADYENLKSGDRITYMTDSFSKRIMIEGANEHYLITPTLIMNKYYYKQIYKEFPVSNSFLLLNESISAKEMNTKLQSIDGFLKTEDYKEASIKSLNDTSGSFILLSFLFLVMSLLMAILVILNLLITFVQTKKKELIVLQINGYSLNQSKRYIYTDTIALTIIGTIFGLIVGTLLGFVCIRAICSGGIIFPTNISWLAIGISVLITFAMVLVMSLFALSKIKKFKLVDLNN